MITDTIRTIVVTGATGLQGEAVVRHLLMNKWRVRALTRYPLSKKAHALYVLGAEIVQGNMEDPDSLRPIFEGAYGVFSVQNPVLSGVEGEITQGKNVANIAKQMGIQHIVYSSAGLGTRGTGVPSWESKLVIEDYMKSLGLPLTVLRLMAFMEIMTEKKFYPAISTWHVMPALMGSSKDVGWISVEDLGYIVAKAFNEPEIFIGKDLTLAADKKTIDECRAMYRETMGRNTPRFPMPVWLFKRFGFIGKDLTTMWRWLKRETFEVDTTLTRSIHPGVMTISTWLEKQKKREAVSTTPQASTPFNNVKGNRE